MRKGRAAVAALVLALSGIATFTLLPARAANATINITDTGLSQPDVTINGGESVVWVNKTQHDVSISSDDGRFSGQTFSGEFSNRFDVSGDYPYTTSQGPNSHGVVHVTSDAATEPTSPPNTTPNTTQKTTPTPRTTAVRTTAVHTTATRAPVPTTYGGTVPLITVPTIPTTTTTTIAGPSTTQGEFAIGQAGSSNRGAIIAVIAVGVAAVAVGGYMAYRRRLRSPV